MWRVRVGFQSSHLVVEVHLQGCCRLLQATAALAYLLLPVTDALLHQPLHRHFVAHAHTRTRAHMQTHHSPES